jgi:hypothetical protein
MLVHRAGVVGTATHAMTDTSVRLVTAYQCSRIMIHQCASTAAVAAAAADLIRPPKRLVCSQELLNLYKVTELALISMFQHEPWLIQY